MYGYALEIIIINSNNNHNALSAQFIFIPVVTQHTGEFAWANAEYM